MKNTFKKLHKPGILKSTKMKQLVGGKSSSGTGNYAISSKSSGFVSWKHLELFRRAISKLFKRKGKKDFKLFVFVNNWKSFTKKPLLSRMGKGSGPINNWKAFLLEGAEILRISSNKPKHVVFLIWKKASRLFPLKTRFGESY